VKKQQQNQKGKNNPTSGTKQDTKAHDQLIESLQELKRQLEDQKKLIDTQKQQIDELVLKHKPANLQVINGGNGGEKRRVEKGKEARSAGK